MNSILTFIAAGVMALALAIGVAAPALAQEGQCLSRREIQERIASGELRQLAEAVADAGVAAKIISSGATVCREDGEWMWRVNVMDEYGESRPLTLPAQ